MDLRDDEKYIKILKDTGGTIQYNEGVKMSKRCGAMGYYECSSKTNRGVNTLLELSIEVGLDKECNFNELNTCIIT